MVVGVSKFKNDKFKSDYWIQIKVIIKIKKSILLSFSEFMTAKTNFNIFGFYKSLYLLKFFTPPFAKVNPRKTEF